MICEVISKPQIISKLLIFSFLAILFSCSNVKPLSQKKMKEYFSHEGGLKKVVDHFAELNLKNNKVIGMVVAVVRPEGVEYFAYGYRDRDKKTAMTTDTIFQIGSITKVFTTSLMSVLEDEKKIDTKLPMGSFMKPSFDPKTKWVKNITLEGLASHSSGLPGEYQNIKMLTSAIKFLFTGENIWKNLEEKEMWTFVENFNFGYQEKKHFRYSNVAYVLLGGLLGKVVPDKSFDTLIEEKITGPLHLTDTAFSLTPEQKTRLATGYSGSAPPFMRRGIAMPPWEFHSGLKAAGGLYSTAHDMVNFLKVNIHANETPLGRSMKKTHARIVSTEKGHVGLGWFMETLPDSKSEQIYVNGIISGYTSYMGFDPITQVGVVVLQNTMNMNYEFGEKFLDRLLLSRE